MGSRWNKIEEAINDSISAAEALRKMGLDPRGANYRKFKRIVKDKNLDISHFRGQAHGTSRQETVPWSDILIKNSRYEITSKRKTRLISDGILNDSCSECGIKTWMGKSLVLHLDHINGDHQDNRIENIRLICPNCHSQTITYCGRNKRKIKPSLCVCGKIKAHTSVRCIECENQRKASCSKIIWPEIVALEKMLESKSYCQVARELGVSDNAIRKHIRIHKVK